VIILGAARRRGTRLLTCHRQAVYVLACLRQPTDVADLGRGPKPTERRT
jgi:hypothetical protein